MDKTELRRECERRFLHDGKQSLIPRDPRAVLLTDARNSASFLRTGCRAQRKSPALDLLQLVYAEKPIRKVDGEGRASDGGCGL
jgi:hypothetical protein